MNVVLAVQFLVLFSFVLFFLNDNIDKIIRETFIFYVESKRVLFYYLMVFFLVQMCLLFFHIGESHDINIVYQ